VRGYQSSHVPEKHGNALQGEGPIVVNAIIATVMLLSVLLALSEIAFRLIPAFAEKNFVIDNLWILLLDASFLLIFIGGKKKAIYEHRNQTDWSHVIYWQFLPVFIAGTGFNILFSAWSKFEAQAVSAFEAFMFTVNQAIAEESFFRICLGLAISTALVFLFGKKRRWIANILTSFITASIWMALHWKVYHAEPLQFASLFIDGIIYELMFLFTKNPFACIITHIFINFGSSLAQLFAAI
jgi:membrane protease YdiL (CAAX protease family)